VRGHGWTQVLASGATPEETAAEVAAEPGFRANPPGSIAHFSTAAAQAFRNGHIDQARYYTAVVLLLVAAADSPAVRVGASVGELADRFGLR
jgi:hypothetical protein